MNTFDEFKDYCRSHLPVVLCTYLAFLALFVAWIAHDVVTFDAEGLYSVGNAAKWYEQWIGIDRWGFVVLKKVLGTMVINPYFSVAALVLLFPLSALLWAFAVDRWGSSRPSWVVLAFCVLYLSHPVWAQQFAYRNQMEVMSLALALAPVGMLLLAECARTRRWAPGLVALGIATLLFGCYQAFVFVYVEAIFIYAFLQFTTRGKDAGEHGGIKELAWGFAFVVAAFALSKGASSVVKVLTRTQYDPAYLASQFLWGQRPVLENLRAILDHLRRVMLGDGNNFTALYIVEAVPLVVWSFVAHAERLRDRLYRAFVSCGVAFTPFLLEVVTAGDVVIRSQFAFVLALAFMGAVELDACHRALGTHALHPWGGVLVALVALAAIVPQAQQQSRLLYSDVTTMEADRRRLEELYFQAMALGAHEGDAACLVGGGDYFHPDSMAETEVVGYSYFMHIGYYDGSKTIEAMQAYRLAVSQPSEEQVRLAQQETPRLEVWPTGGSISVHDGYYVVRLS